jgi:adenylate cyclase
MTDDMATAEVHRRHVLALDPDFTAETYLMTLHYKNEADSNHHLEALLKAGLPAALQPVAAS